jgi:CBS domain-containing protein
LEKVAADIMHSLNSFPSVRENESVKRALDVMATVVKNRKQPYLIVVKNGSPGKQIIKGFITPQEIVFEVMGNYLKGADHIGPIYWEGQLETECEKAFRRPVGDIIAPVKICINATGKLMEAVFLLYKYRLGVLPVARCEEIIGIIHLNDILEEIVGMVPG